MTTALARRSGLVAAVALGMAGAVAGAGVMWYRRYREEQERAPAGGPRLAGVRKGMAAQSADEITLGTIAAIWQGVDPLDPTLPSDDDICSRLEVRRPEGALYVPYSAIGGVAGRSVILNVTAAQVETRPWRYRPDWLPPSGGPAPAPQRA